jgi:hypothetical protein
VGHLVIGDGERSAGAGIEGVGAQLVAHAQPARLPEYPVEMHRLIDVG